MNVQTKNKEILDWNTYSDIAIEIASEGCVLLENKNNVLPYKKGTKLSVFGRIQNNYYKSGTGSGGMVNVDKVIGIVEALKESGHVEINQKLVSIYEEWEKENPFEEGIGWGKEPWCQEEMPLSLELASEMAKISDEALVIIGRTAGEDKDNKAEKGSYFLTDLEENMISVVKKAFGRVTVLLNVGNIIDMNFVKKYDVDSVMYVWHGGMLGGYGASNVLTGKTAVSGRLADTIASSINDYPSNDNFGGAVQNIYKEDIFVGYRFFETFEKDKVLYPFGFGLSYTTFDYQIVDFVNNNSSVKIYVKVTNTGNFPSKDVIQIYCSQSQGVLGKSALVLAAFDKTKELQSGENQILSFEIELSSLASFDDLGLTNNKSCMVLEKGEYTFFAAKNVRDLKKAGSVLLEETIVTEKLHKACAPIISFERLKAVKNGDKIEKSYEKICETEKSQRKNRDLYLQDVKKEFNFVEPAEISSKIKLSDVESGKNTIKEFLSELTNEDLFCIIRGEGMGSPRVTAGTAAAFGGVTEHLKELQVPCGCCSDGPSGLRLDSGNHAFSMPIGTMIACTFNTVLAKKLYEQTGKELVYNKIDVLLAPGMNIHRHPLNGRNFEYFSEDPLVTGLFASAIIQGLHQSGVTGSLKHFCANNQEYKRLDTDSIMSERALREIYLKGFEIAVKKANADVIMTTYGSLNGFWTAGNYDLNTTILRKEWGFKGIVITDWWAKVNDENSEPNRNNFAPMVRAQNDLYMVCPCSEKNLHGDNTQEQFNCGNLDRSELLRNAENIISFLLKSRAYKRLLNKDVLVEMINRSDSTKNAETLDVGYFKIKDKITINLEEVEVNRGKSFTFALDAESEGWYEFDVVGRTKQGVLAQVPISIAVASINVASLTWNGTDGQWEKKTTGRIYLQKYPLIKLFFAQNGLELKEISVRLIKANPASTFPD